MSHGKASIFCSLVLGGTATSQGCVDTSPIDYQAPIDDGGSAVVVEAGLRAACAECVKAETCAEQYATCRADERCALLGDCLIDTYCFNFDITNLANLKPCLVECALKANIVGADDPAVALFAPLIRCAQLPTQCGPVCDVR